MGVDGEQLVAAERQQVGGLAGPVSISRKLSPPSSDKRGMLSRLAAAFVIGPGEGRRRDQATSRRGGTPRWQRSFLRPVNSDSLNQLRPLSSLAMIQPAWPVLPDGRARWRRGGDRNSVRCGAGEFERLALDVEIDGSVQLPRRWRS